MKVRYLTLASALALMGSPLFAHADDSWRNYNDCEIPSSVVAKLQAQLKVVIALPDANGDDFSRVPLLVLSFQLPFF